MTLDVYADRFDEDLDGVADRLDSAIRSTADPGDTMTRGGWKTAHQKVELTGLEPVT
jgi:hypothetical protein